MYEGPNIEETPQVTWTGYVKLDAFYDSRQVIANREGHFLFFPRPKFFDSNGRDINAHNQYNMTAIETRLTANITGPRVLCAQTRALIQADFWGNHEETITCFRLRHAYIDFDWEKDSLLFGQYWHPLFVLECFPETVSFNNGSPIDTYARNPQVRYTHTFERGDITLSALAQMVGFRNTGPIGYSTTYVRNAVVPMLDFWARYFVDKHIFGVIVDFKRLVPRLFSSVGENLFKVNESINSVIVAGYMTLTFDWTRFKVKAIYAQDGTDQSLLGGYAVATRNAQTGKQTYANIRNASVWMEISAINYELKPALFIGYTKNLGATRNLFTDPSIGINTPIIYANAPTIDYVFRVSPRVIWDIEPVRFGIEIEYTRAAFAKLDSCPGAFNSIDCKGRIRKAIPVNNLRLLFAAYYFF